MRAVPIVVMLACVAGSVRADDGADAAASARKLAEAAMRRIDDGSDYLGASELFQKAYDLTRDLPYLINVAVTLRKGKLPHHAVAAYRRSLAEGGAALTPELRARILADIEHITNESAQVTVRTEGAAAEIRLDTRLLGTAARDAPLLVLIQPEAGRAASLTASRPGFETATATLTELEPGKASAIVIEPRAIPKTATVTIATIPSAARLSTRAMGPLGLAPRALDLGLAPRTVELAPGDHEITATMPGYEPRSEKILVRAGEPRQLSIRLVRREPSWWTRHKRKLYIGGVVVLGASAAVATRELLRPEYVDSISHPD